MCGFAMAHILSPITSPGAGNRLAVYPNALLQAFCAGGEGGRPPSMHSGGTQCVTQCVTQLYLCNA